jgi:hypothetical protein
MALLHMSRRQVVADLCHEDVCEHFMLNTERWTVQNKTSIGFYPHEADWEEMAIYDRQTSMIIHT